MKPVPGQLLMPFLGAVEGASLEAQVARMRGLVDGLNADQLRRLYREHKRDGAHFHVSRVIEDALIAAMRIAPADGEDMPNSCGVIEKASPDWVVKIAAIQVEIFTGRTRWGYVATLDYSWRTGAGGSATSPLKITDDAFRSRALAGAASLEALIARLLRIADRNLEDEYLLDLAAAIGALTQRAFMLRHGLAIEKPKPPAAAKPKKPMPAPAKHSKTKPAKSKPRRRSCPPSKASPARKKPRPSAGPAAS